MIVFPMYDWDAPVGGMRITYGMVDALNAAGLDAAVWHADADFTSAWAGPMTRRVFGLERELEPGDVIVMPELAVNRHQDMVGDAKVVVLNQNHFHSLSRATEDLDAPLPGWPHAVGAIATSMAIQAHLAALAEPRFPIHPVRLCIDPVMAAHHGQRRREVVMMAHRRHDDTAMIEVLLRRHLPEGWTLRVLRGLPPREVAVALGRAAIFVSTADHDGFSLPGAEAMAAGAYVVGFDGGGAREYLLPTVSTVVRDPDLVGLTEAVVAAARRFEEDRVGHDASTAAAAEFVTSTYTQEAFEDSTVSALTALLEAGAGQSHARVVRHFGALGRRTSRQRAADLVGTVVRAVSPRPVQQRRPAPGVDRDLAVGARHPGVSVLVPHHGDPALALAVVEDLRHQRSERPIQIVVTDDCSPVPFPDVEGVDVVRHDENRGFGAAVNSAAGRAVHPWLWILNSDVRLGPDLLESMVLAAEGLQPAICSPLLVEANGRPSATANRFQSSWSALVGFQGVARLQERGLLDPVVGFDTECVPGVRRRTDWLLGAALMVRREHFEEVHGFDDRFFMYCEEMDLQRRLAGIGVSAWFLGDLTASHAGGGSTGGNRSRWLDRAQFVYARKWGFHRRLTAARVVLLCANLGYNLARDAAGKQVGAVDNARAEWSGLRRALRSSRP